MAKGRPYHKEVVMKQESLYTLDDIELEILNRIETGEPQTMPTEIEEIILQKRFNNRNKFKCDSCPTKSEVAYFLVVGDTSLMKMCPHCKKRLKKIINHIH